VEQPQAGGCAQSELLKPQWEGQVTSTTCVTLHTGFSSKVVVTASIVSSFLVFLSKGALAHESSMAGAPALYMGRPTHPPGALAPQACPVMRQGCFPTVPPPLVRRRSACRLSSPSTRSHCGTLCRWEKCMRSPFACTHGLGRPQRTAVRARKAADRPEPPSSFCLPVSRWCCWATPSRTAHEEGRGAVEACSPRVTPALLLPFTPASWRPSSPRTLRRTWASSSAAERTWARSSRWVGAAVEAEVIPWGCHGLQLVHVVLLTAGLTPSFPRPTWAVPLPPCASQTSMALSANEKMAKAVVAKHKLKKKLSRAKEAELTALRGSMDEGDSEDAEMSAADPA